MTAARDICLNMYCAINIQIAKGRIVKTETTVTMLKVTDNFLSDATALECCGGGLLLNFMVIIILQTVIIRRVRKVKVRSDHRSEFSNLCNWKLEA